MASLDTSASPVSSTATSSATSPGSSSFTAAPPTAMTSSSSAATPPPFIFGTASASQFAPLFSSGATISPAAPAAAPRHPIFGDHITNHIKFLLNPADHNYHKWKTFFLMVLLRYGVSYLTEQPPPPNAPPAYLELDAHVVLWIYATLSDTMCDHVVGATTTFALWHKIKDFFLANRAARYMSLNRQYRNLKQGDLSVSEYARRMKLLTDGLADIDHAVTEVDLTTQFLHGLDKRLDTIRVVLGDQDLPFDTVLSRVTLAEESQAQRAADESASAFALTGGSPSGANSTPGRGDRGGRGVAAATTPDATPAPPAAPFTGYFAPYGMALPPPRPGWIPPNAAGVLGPRPGSHAQAYPMLLSPPPSFYPPPSPSWEHAAMLNAAYSGGGFPSQPAPRVVPRQRRVLPRDGKPR
ncbi:hypothetical protein D1007_61852 [Hordeum vulgare]|nr:hypothetical protein D1007_61852 [Hordeum vulgare]